MPKFKASSCGNSVGKDVFDPIPSFESESQGPRIRTLTGAEFRRRKAELEARDGTKVGADALEKARRLAKVLRGRTVAQMIITRGRRAGQAAALSVREEKRRGRKVAVAETTLSV